MDMYKIFSIGVIVGMLLGQVSIIFGSWLEDRRKKTNELPQCEKCGSSFLWSNDGSVICCNLECGNRHEAH